MNSVIGNKNFEEKVQGKAAKVWPKLGHVIKELVGEHFFTINDWERTLHFIITGRTKNTQRLIERKSYVCATSNSWLILTTPIRISILAYQSLVAVI